MNEIHEKKTEKFIGIYITYGKKFKHNDDNHSFIQKKNGLVLPDSPQKKHANGKKNETCLYFFCKSKKTLCNTQDQLTHGFKCFCQNGGMRYDSRLLYVEHIAFGGFNTKVSIDSDKILVCKKGCWGPRTCFKFTMN